MKRVEEAFVTSSRYELAFWRWPGPGSWLA